MKKIISVFLACILVCSVIAVPDIRVFALTNLQFEEFEQLGKGYNMLGGKQLENSTLKTGLLAGGDGMLADLTYVGTTYASASCITDMDEYFLNETERLSIEFEAKISSLLVAIGVKVKFDNTNISEYSNAQSSYFSSVDVNAIAYKYDMGIKTDYSVIRNNLTEQFRSALSDPDVDPATLFSNYGTHMIIAYQAGGVASAYTSGVSTAKKFKTDDKYELNTSVKIGEEDVAEATLSAGYENQKTENAESDNKKIVSHSYVRGGNNFFAKTPAGDSAVDTAEYNTWLESLSSKDVITNGTKTQIITDDALKFVAVWELLPDGEEERKAELKSYFDVKASEYIKEFYGQYIYKNEVPETESFEEYRDCVLISTADEFDSIRNDLSGKYFIVNNIDMSGITNFMPIGTKEEPFKGVITGNDVSISGIKSVGENPDYSAYGIVCSNEGKIEGITVEGCWYDSHGDLISNYTIVSVPVKSISDCGNIDGMTVETVYDSIEETPENIDCEEKGNVIILDWSEENSSSVGKTFSVSSDVGAIGLIGGEEKGFNDMNIVIEKRETPLSIYLQNFNLTAQKEHIAIDGQKAPLLNIHSYGEKNVIKGGDGYGGVFAADSDGQNGADGTYAVIADSVCIGGTGEIYIYGGNGGDAADGSEGSDGATAGASGNPGYNGGNGGQGGIAVLATDVKIIEDVQLYIIGGNGGKGGNGGTGGDGAEGRRAKVSWGDGYNGGTGGSGGKGGNGGTGGKGNIAAVFGNLTSTNNKITVLIGGSGAVGGDGGQGGNGGDGGDSYSYSDNSGNWVVSSQFSGINGGKGGNTGSGGAGGSGGLYSGATYNDLATDNVYGRFLYEAGKTSSLLSSGGDAGDTVGVGGEKGSVRYTIFGGSKKTDTGKAGSDGNASGIDGAYGTNPEEAFVQRILIENYNLYALIKNTATYSQAQQVGAENNAKIVSVINSEIQDNVDYLIAETDCVNCWIGASDIKKEGTWKWENEEAVSFEKWGIGNPANITGEEDFAYYDVQDDVWRVKNGSETCDYYILERPIKKEGRLSLDGVGKTTYISGQSLDKGSIELWYINEDGRKQKIIPSIRYDFSTPGIASVLLIYGENTLCFPVKVLEKAIAKISVASKSKTDYIYGEPFEVPLLDIEYNNGEKSVAVPELNDCEADMSSHGIKEITVTYSGLTTEYEINIEKCPVSGQITVSGNLGFGDVLHAETSEILPPDATFTCQWYRDGIAINGATQGDYTIIREDLGKSVTVRISANGNYSGTIESPAVIPLCEHIYENWQTLIPASCISPGTEIGTCICGETRERNTDETAHIFTAERAESQYLCSIATCKMLASYYKSCEVCNLSSKNTEDEACFSAGNYAEHVITHVPAKPADCLNYGWNAYDECSVCTYSSYERIPEKGHSPVTDAAEKATCEKTGLTEGTHCSVCREVLVEQTVIEKEDHVWGEWQETEKATTEKAGKETRKCKNCKKTEDRDIPVLKPQKIVALGSSENVIISENGFAFINALTTVSDILSETNGTAVCSDNKQVTNLKSKLATGMKIVLNDGEKTVDTVTVVIPGDIDADGVISASDARLALRQSVSLEDLKNERLAAAMVNGAVKVTAAEARLILRASVALEDNTLWLEKVS